MSKSYYEQNRETILNGIKEYREQNKEKIKEQRKKYYEQNKQRIKERYELNKESIQEKNKLKYQENKETIKLKVKEYKQQNKSKRNESERTRRVNDPLWNLTRNIRTNVNASIKRINENKQSKTELILGCSFKEFKKYIESKFESWMNWDNYGNPKDGIFEPNKTWDLDHIKPTSTALTYDEVIKLNHYTNIQPLCSYQNRFIKSNKV